MGNCPGRPDPYFEPCQAYPDREAQVAATVQQIFDALTAPGRPTIHAFNFWNYDDSCSGLARFRGIANSPALSEAAAAMGASTAQMRQ